MGKRRKDPALLAIWGIRLARIRAVLGLDQQVLADQMGVGNKTLSNWERGHAPPDQWFLHNMYDVYAVDPAYILCGRMDGLPAWMKEKLQNVGGQ